MLNTRMLIGFLACIILIGLGACSKDDKQKQSGTPDAVFEKEEYKVKLGRQVAITATTSNAVHPVYSWKLNGQIISTQQTCMFTGSETGEFFVLFRMDAENGSIEKQVKVTVMAKLPPEIDMPSAIIAYAGQDKKIVRNVLYADSATYTWRLDGGIVSQDTLYVFNQTGSGTHQLSLKVATTDGEDLRTFTLTVLPPPVPEMFFDDGHYHITGDNTTKRLSVPLGKTLALAPVLLHIDDTTPFVWTVNGATQDEAHGILTFTPSAKGTYAIVVTAGGATAKVNVECVAAEGTYFRAPVAGSRSIATKAFEFVPAPGQFTDFQQGSTAEQARLSIQSSLDANATEYIAGLGAYGGYFITGFDHSVSNVAGKADLRINGNAFQGWSEPGIVWVMQDENGNGLPDDTWYELAGSETGKPGTKQRYAITYFKPANQGSDVLWLDNQGQAGSVDYNQYHLQPYYFPMFIQQSSYTLSGTRVATTFISSTIDTAPGYAWGYVDNYGDGSKLNFWLEDAIRADGRPANLQYIDFVRIQTGMLGKGVAVGEISTEAGAPFDLNLK